MNSFVSLSAPTESFNRWEINQTGTSVQFKTKGDNNDVQDIWSVKPELVKGKYLASVPYIGYITVLVKNPKMFAIFIGIPTLLLIALQIKKIKEGIEEEIQKRVEQRQKETLPGGYK